MPSILGTIFPIVSSQGFQNTLHRVAEWLPGRRRVRFFHALGDPHSHLALQALPSLLECFDVDLELVLIGEDAFSGFGGNTRDVQDWTFNDCKLLQELYQDLGFTLGTVPGPEAALAAAATLAAACQNCGAGAVPLDAELLDLAISLGRKLWSSQSSPESEAPPESDLSQVKKVLQENYEQLAQKHLAGGVMNYRGETYWGIDRLAHLERRLIGAGASRDAGSQSSAAIFDRTEHLRFEPGAKLGAEAPEVELFYSFRSPYSQLILRDLFRLCKHYGVAVRIRPVVPMAMRGFDVSKKKLYIIRDFWREMHRLNLNFAAMNDPLGEPTLRAMRVWPLAEKHGRGQEFLTAWADCVYGQFVAAGTDDGLRRIVEAAGLSWAEAEVLANGTGLPDFEEQNRRILYEELKHWGVPCLRFGDVVLWGQDRLWALEAAFLRRLASPAESAK